MTDRLAVAVEALINSIDMDVNGILLPTGWRGSNGGLISNETIKCTDEARRALQAWRQQQHQRR